MFDFKTANFTNRLARGICILEVSHRAWPYICIVWTYLLDFLVTFRVPLSLGSQTYNVRIF